MHCEYTALISLENVSLRKRGVDHVMISLFVAHNMLMTFSPESCDQLVECGNLLLVRITRFCHNAIFVIVSRPKHIRAHTSVVTIRQIRTGCLNMF